MLQSPMCSDFFCLIQQSFLYLPHLAHWVQFLGIFTYLFSAYILCSQLDCMFLKARKQTVKLVTVLSAVFTFNYVSEHLLFSLTTREMMGSVDVYSISFGKTNRTNDFFPEITPIKHCSLSCIKTFNSNLRAKSMALSRCSSDVCWLFFRICQEAFEF